MLTNFKLYNFSAYFVYIILSFIGCVAFYIWVPETMNVPLEEIARLFGKNKDVAVTQEEVLRAREFEKVDEGSSIDEAQAPKPY